MMNQIDAAAAINLYLARRGSAILDLAAEGLRSKGLIVWRGLIDPRFQLTITRNGIKAIWNLSRTLQSIATSPDGMFDSRLTNSAYEMVKTNTILSTQLRVVVALMCSVDEQERIQTLSQISNEHSNLSIQIFKPGA